jgi:ABC-type multidrug transport system ATPase subunit
MIEIRNLEKTYRGGVRALDNVSLSIGTGMFGLLGPNGAGKTTLMRILAGLLNPTAGSVTVFGNDLSTTEGKYATKTVLGYLPQDLGLYPNLSAREFLDYVAILKGVSDRARRAAQIEQLLEVVRLTDTSNRKLRTFSGGMRRRVGIAQALLGDPKLIIVDEPTTGLDPEERVRLRNFLGELARKCTVILSTHIIEDISASCRQLAVLAKGRVLFTGTPGDLVRSAQGKVWTIRSDGPAPNHGLSVVTTLQLADTVQYRVLGQDARPWYEDATPIEPTLEDGYIWLMKERAADAATS